MKKTLTVIIVILGLVVGSEVIFRAYSKKTIGKLSTTSNQTLDTHPNSNQEGDKAQHKSTGSSSNSTVFFPSLSRMGFYSQAPFAKWDNLHQEACEEASLLMVHYWLTGQSPTLTQHELNIQNMVKWEAENSFPESINHQQIISVAKRYLNIDLVEVDLKKAPDAQNILDSGRPLIVAASGKDLHNPYFRNGGPLYHMLVIIGYDNGNFITMDPGTRHGNHYQYREDIILGAIADWQENDAVPSRLALTLQN